MEKKALTLGGKPQLTWRCLRSWGFVRYPPFLSEMNHAGKPMPETTTIYG
jgi:hypothetical protein